MSLIHHYRPVRFVADAAIDPTGTSVIVRRYENDMVGRFRKARAKLRQAIVVQDVLGLRNRPDAINLMHVLMTSSVDRIAAVTDWFYQVEQRDILGTTPGTLSRVAAQSTWQGKYLQASYDKGRHDAAARLNAILDARRRPLPPDDRVEIIKARSFTELEGITDETARRISRLLSEGMAEGSSPEEIAREIAQATDVSITRARTLVRTEMIGAHAEASLNTYEAAGTKRVRVKAEFVTAGDSNVCPICEDLEGDIMTIAEARGLIPVHPNCRCAWLPVLQ